MLRSIAVLTLHKMVMVMSHVKDVPEQRICTASWTDRCLERRVSIVTIASV